MDVKTLSTVIGHVSSATTLNVYAHVTDDMQRQAAARIDRGIGKAEVAESTSIAKSMSTMTDFRPIRERKRRWGTGSLSKNQNGQWVGRYTTHGQMEGWKHERSMPLLRRNAKGCWRR